MLKKGFLLSVLAAMLAGVTVTAQTRQVRTEQDGPKELQDTLSASRVTADKLHRDNSTQTGLIRLDAKKITRGYAVFSTPDIIKTLQTLPGVATGTELLSGLYVHGGDGSDNLYLLDGVPLYQASHLAGLFSSFNTDVVDNLDFYKSGFPARYGGRLSSVVDVATRDGDMNEYHGVFSIGAIDGRFQIEGPIVKGRTSFNFGIRRTWMDAITIPVIAYANRELAKEKAEEKISGHYQMNDTNFKLTHLISKDNKLTFNFYYGSDALRMGAAMMGHDYVYPDGGNGYIYDDEYNIIGYQDPISVHSGEDKYDIGVRWGNVVTSAVWQKKWSEKLASSLSAFYTVSRGRISVDIDMWGWDRWEEVDTHELIDDSNISRIDDFGVNAAFDWLPSDSHHVRYGGTVQIHIYHPSRSFSWEQLSDGKKIFGSADSESFHYTGAEAAVYAEDEINFSDRLKGNAGLRYSLFYSPGKAWQSLEPRAALKWQMNDELAVKASYSEMSQFSHLVSCMYLDLPTNCWMPSTSKVRPMKSRQVAGGLYTSFTPELTLNLEFYYKTMDHLLEYSGTGMILPPIDKWETSFVEGRGRAYGAEFECSYDWENTNLTAYYTLSWSQRKFDDFYAYWYLDRNDNRHKITLSASHTFKHGFELYGSWNYHTGGNVTFPTYVEVQDGNPYGYGSYLYDRPNNTKLPDYHRLDLGLNWHRTTKRGREAVWNLSVYNAYCRLNPIMATLDWDQYGNYYGTAYGIIPIIPTFSYTLKF